MARIRDDVDQLIELFAEIALPNEPNGANTSIAPAPTANSKKDNSNEAFILRTFPLDYANKEILTSVPSFAYPHTFRCDVVTHFSFVLTNINGNWLFGYCRHTPKSDTCLVILSDLPWHSTFYRVLDHCAELSARPSAIPLERFLDALFATDLPQPGLELHVTYTCEDFRLREFKTACPDHQKLPCIPEDRNVTEYFNAVSTANMITIFASMLNERRIVITSDRLNRLSACVQAANALICPMHWQHIFIPLLPSHLLDYLSAPMPFLIGVPHVTLARVKRAELGDIVLLNADTNQLSTPFDDVSMLPSDVLHTLRKALKQSSPALGDGLCRAFLRALVSLIGGYRAALQIVPGEQITFNRDAFVATVRGTSRQLFLERMLQLQIFQQFIETRLDLFNKGERFDDQFEVELNHQELQSGGGRFKAQYREWTATMRKEGGALLRAVNPRVKSAISKSRLAVRNLRSAIMAPPLPGGGGNSASGISAPDYSQYEFGATPQHQHQGHLRGTSVSSAPSSPKHAPAKMKKSTSGTAISQTSRTVTYVRAPNSISTTAISTGSGNSGSSGAGGNSGNHLRITHSDSKAKSKNKNSNRSSSSSSSGGGDKMKLHRSQHGKTHTNIGSLNPPIIGTGIAPSASSESSDVDDIDAIIGNTIFYANHNRNSNTKTTSAAGLPPTLRVDMNICDELENIFRDKTTLTAAAGNETSISSSNSSSSNSCNSSRSSSDANVIAPIPPPRSSAAAAAAATNFSRKTLKPISLATTTSFNDSKIISAAPPSKCLIEFDSPPKECASKQLYNHQNSNTALLFDPLLDSNYRSEQQQQQQQQVNQMHSSISNNNNNHHNHCNDRNDLLCFASTNHHHGEDDNDEDCLNRKQNRIIIENGSAPGSTGPGPFVHIVPPPPPPARSKATPIISGEKGQIKANDNNKCKQFEPMPFNTANLINRFELLAPQKASVTTLAASQPQNAFASSATAAAAAGVSNQTKNHSFQTHCWQEFD